MLGFRLLTLGLIGLLRKFPQTIAVSLLPAGVLVLGFVLLDRISLQIYDFDTNFWINFAGFFVIVIPTLSWMAVNWHRVAILNAPIAFLPRLRAWVWARYMWHLTLMTAGIVAFYFGAFLILDVVFTKILVTQRNDVAVVLISLGMGIVVFTLSTWVWMRLMLCLPALAIGDPTSFRQSWRQTVGYTPTILVISYTLLVVIIGAIAILLVAFPSLSFGWLIFIWFMTAVFVAVMTEFYTYVRALNDVKEVFE